MILPSRAVREDAQILLHRNEGGYRQRFLIDFASASIVVDAHHIAILDAVLVTLDTAIGAALGDDASAKVWSGLHLDLGRMRQALGSLRRNCGRNVCG